MVPVTILLALPQVQDRTLTEREEFLSQSQERSNGLVVYTGMNNKGDFFIGNRRNHRQLVKKYHLTFLFQQSLVKIQQD